MAAVATRKLPALTSLRFFAAALVVFAHLRGKFGLSPTLGLENFQFAQGVSFFFVLSGFILTYVYQRLEGREAVKRFLMARVARLWPAHILALAVSAALLVNPGLGWNTRTLLKSLASLTMIHAWIPNPDYFHFLNSVAWSISTEFFFYLAFVVLIQQLNLTWPWKLSLSLSLAIVGCLIVQSGHLPGAPRIDAGALTYINPLGRLVEFTLGMCFGLLFLRLQNVNYGMRLGTTIELAAVALLVGAAHVSYKCGGAEGWLVNYVGSSVANWLSWGPGAAPAFGVLILVIGLERGWVSRMLSAPPLVLLGEISYTVYLFHILLIRLYQEYSAALQGVPDWLLLTGYWAILLLLSHLIWSLWERPLRTLILALWARRRETGVAAKSGHSEAAPATFWTPLFAPGGKLIGAELAVLVLLLIPVVSLATRPAYSLVSAQQARELSANSLLGPETVEFGGQYILRSVNYQVAEGGYNVQLVWESCQDQRLDNWLCVHLLDAKQEQKAKVDRLQDPRQRRMSKGALWTEEAFVPHNLLGGDVEALAIGIWHPTKGVLKSEQADEDAAHWRVLLPLPNDRIAMRASADDRVQR